MAFRRKSVTSPIGHVLRARGDPIDPQPRATSCSPDLYTATRLAHTTKGVSGNIGATPVQHLAEALEQADWPLTDTLLASLPQGEQLAASYLDAVSWTEQILAS